jgi:DNA-binding beta-propeller fold protein YncE
MDVSPDGEHLYVVLDNSIHVLDASNGSLLDIIIVENKQIEINIIIDICVSPDGNFLFVLFNGLKYNYKIVKYAVFGSAAYSTMGGKRYKKKGIRQKRSKNRARYSKKRGTKRKQRK